MAFIYAGRLDELKGVRTLLDAWEFMGDIAPELVICGTGPLEELCAAYAAKLPVACKGFIEKSEVTRFIAESDALVLPTLWYEGFPMTIAEAFSVGTPVICSDLGNAGSLVEEGLTGWKFPPGYARGLAEAVGRCVDSHGALRENVRREYELKYTPEANYSLLSEIYTEVRNADRSAGSQRR